MDSDQKRNFEIQNLSIERIEQTILTVVEQNFINQFGYTIRTHNAFYVPAGDPKLSL